MAPVPCPECHLELGVETGREDRSGMQQNLRDEQGGWPSSSRHSQFSGSLSWCHH